MRCKCTFMIWLGLILQFVLIQPVLAGTPSSKPILRLDPGMHAAAIKHVGVDASGRWLVTGSHDKTLRLWSLPDGRLIRTIRPPIGKDNEGEINAVAMTPDGKTIVCGGWTGYEWDRRMSIYIIDRASGRITGRIKGLPEVLAHLSFSRDGRHLVAMLIGNHGIRIFRTSDWKQVAADANYASDTYGGEFAPDGRLVTVSWDGFVRLYDRNFKLLSKRQTPGGRKPYAAAFSPDGKKIAIGYQDAPRVDVLSADTLAVLYSPDTKGLGRGRMLAMGWSAVGNKLYGGRGIRGPFTLRAWTNEGRGGYWNLPGANNSIFHIISLKNGDMVYAAADPAFGIMSHKGNRILFKGPHQADYRMNRKGFLISADGSTIRFAFELWGRTPAEFSVFSRVVKLNPPKGSNLSAAKTEAPGLKFSDWKDTSAPRLNGKRLPMERYETSRSLAIAPDERSFILGTGWNLRRYDKGGKLMWKVPLSSIAWAVNISGNGKLAVAALGDGTIRWFRMQDGKELLAFFPHSDRKRWVIWTPNGYFDASPGAEGLIGWHVNNGPAETASFYPVSKFREQFYRPEVFVKVLNVLDEGKAIQLVDAASGRKKQKFDFNKMLPPEVEIVEPRDGATIKTGKVTIRYRIHSKSGEPVTNVRAMVDGRPAPKARGLRKKSKQGLHTIEVTVPAKDVTIALIAENRFATSNVQTVRLRWAGTRSVGTVGKSKLYVLAIGVSDYRNTALKLGYAAKDARDFANVLLRQKGRLYKDVVIKVLADKGASKNDILDGLEWIEQATTSQDVAIVFLAGHGVNDRRGNYYFLPMDADTDHLKRTAIAFSELQTTMASLPGKVLFFVDTCHSGNIMGKALRPGVADINAVVNKLIEVNKGIVVFTASTGNESSLENPRWGNGAFTKALVEGLMGKADFMRKGKITISLLTGYISERVKELTGERQTPTTAKPFTIPDLTVALVQ